MTEIQDAKKRARTAEADAINDDYLATLEEVKKQYERYVEISGINRLPGAPNGKKPSIPPAPTPENPLTHHKFPGIR